MTAGGPEVTAWDFFVSYQQADRGWAEWIAWQLENAGHSVLFQPWDFVPGTNWITLMQDGVTRSARVITVLSGSYIGSVFGAAEWQAIWALDGQARRAGHPGPGRRLRRPGLLGGIAGIDLFGIPEPRHSSASRRHQPGPGRPGENLEPAPVPGNRRRQHKHGTGSPAATGGTPGPRTTAPDPGARRPRFPGRKYQVDVRGGQGIQIGDNNTQINRW